MTGSLKERMERITGDVTGSLKVSGIADDEKQQKLVGRRR
jgi:hypothetical protein